MSKSGSVLVISIIGCILVILTWILSPIIIIHLFPDNNNSISELFAPISSLFSGLAFLGVIITILLQRQELIAQRKELELTRNVHVESVKLIEMRSQQELSSNLIQSYNLLIIHKTTEIKKLSSNLTQHNKSVINKLDDEISEYHSKLHNLTQKLEKNVFK